MNKFRSILLLFILIVINVGCKHNCFNSSSNKDLTSTGEYNISPVVLSKNYIEIYIDEFDFIEITSEYSCTWYIDDKEIINIEYLENNSYKVIGLKEGETIIHALSLNGKHADCTVKVLSK